MFIFKIFLVKMYVAVKFQYFLVLRTKNRLKIAFYLIPRVKFFDKFCWMKNATRLLIENTVELYLYIFS